MNPIEKKFGLLSSSVDPQQLGTTVQSVARVLAGLLVFGGMLSAADYTTLLSHVNALVTTILTIIPLGYAAYHSAEAIFGILRKGMVAFAQKAPATVQAVDSVS